MRLLTVDKAFQAKAKIEDAEPLTVYDRRGVLAQLVPLEITAHWRSALTAGGERLLFNYVVIFGYMDGLKYRTDSIAWYRDDLAGAARERMDTAPAWVRDFVEGNTPEGGES